MVTQIDPNQVTIWDSIKHTHKSCVNITDVKEWLDMIENPPEHFLETIKALRSFGKSHPLFDTLKRSLPVAQLHGVFPDRKLDSLKSLSGLIYIDIDEGDPNVISQKLKTKPYVHSFWKSVSERGFGVLVQVEPFEPNDVVNVQKLIAFDLGISIDKNALGLGRCNFLSYDKDLWINPRTVPFRIPNESVLLPYLNEKKKLKECDTLDFKPFVGFGSELKFEVVLDSYPKDVVFREAPYFNAYWPWSSHEGVSRPKVITEGDRYTKLSLLVNNLCLLNPEKIDQVKLLIFSWNKKYCSPSLSDSEVLKIVETTYRQTELKPMGVIIKRYWINPQSLNKLKRLGEARQERSISIIEDVLSYLLCSDSKITPTLISKESGLGRKTIYRYLPMFKEEIEKFNQKLRKRKKFR